MDQKDFKTYRQQINILRKKGMSINTNGQSSRVIKKLKLENYYSVINGYKQPFLSNQSKTERYIKNLTFNEMYSLFVFDRNIRVIYLKYLLKIEHYIKSVLAYEFSKKYGNKSYLIQNNFDISTNQKIASVKKLINKINTAIYKQLSKNAEVTHYQTTYGYIPLWVLTNILTIGEISHFYECLKPSDMNSIARNFSLNPYDMVIYLKNLTLARNLCAHDERFYNSKYKNFIPTKNIKNFSILGIPSNNNGLYYYGTKDAFSIALLFTLFLPKRDIFEFVSLMNKEFNRLKKQLKVISIDVIKREMGFGTNWKNLTKL